MAKATQEPELGPLARSLARLMASHLVKGKPISANELSKRSKVPQSTITRMLSGYVTDPRASSLERIAAYFNVTLAALRGEDVVPVVAGQQLLHRLSPDELELLMIYRSANPTGQVAIAGAASGIASGVKAAEVVKKIR